MATALWFKQIYVPAILAGQKTDTIRGPGCRPLAVGQAVVLCVGPRPPFAEAIVTAFEQLPAESLASDRLEAAQAFYGESPTYTRIAFRVTHSHGSQEPANKPR